MERRRPDRRPCPREQYGRYRKKKDSKAAGSGQEDDASLSEQGDDSEALEDYYIQVTLANWEALIHLGCDDQVEDELASVSLTYLADMKWNYGEHISFELEKLIEEYYEMAVTDPDDEYDLGDYGEDDPLFNIATGNHQQQGNTYDPDNPDEHFDAS